MGSKIRLFFNMLSGAAIVLMPVLLQKGISADIASLPKANRWAEFIITAFLIGVAMASITSLWVWYMVKQHDTIPKPKEL